MLSIIRRAISWTKSMTLAKRTSSSVANIFGLASATLLVFCSAFAVYAAFYFLYVPVPIHVKQVHFQFKTHGYAEQTHGYDQFPTAIVSLRNGGPSQESDGERILARGQRYTVSLILDVPLSEENKKVGMFMTKMTFLSKQDREVGSASRSALITFASPIVSTLGSIFDFFLLHWKWKQEKERLDIKLFESFVDDSYNPSESVEIKIFCKYLQIYTAEIRIEAVFSGIRYYMFYWPFTTATLGITSNILVGLILAVWLYFKFCRDSSDDEDEFEESFEIEDIFGAGFNTDTDSIATATVTNQREGQNHEQQSDLRPNEGNDCDTPLVNVRSNQQSRPLVHARRMGLMQPRTREEFERRDPPVSLTHRLRSSRSMKDEAVQTDLSRESNSEPSGGSSELEKVD